MHAKQRLWLFLSLLIITALSLALGNLSSSFYGCVPSWMTFLSHGNVNGFYANEKWKPIFFPVLHFVQYYSHSESVTLNVPYISESCIEVKIFILTLICGASKDFMRAFKAFIKSFQAPQKVWKIKI